MEGKFQIDNQSSGGIGSVKLISRQLISPYLAISSSLVNLGITDLSVQRALQTALDGGDHIDLEDELGLDESAHDFSAYNPNNANPLILHQLLMSVLLMHTITLS